MVKKTSILEKKSAKNDARTTASGTTKIEVFPGYNNVFVGDGTGGRATTLFGVSDDGKNNFNFGEK